MTEDQTPYEDERGVWCPRCQKFHGLDGKQKMRAAAMRAVADAVGSALTEHDHAADDLDDQIALVCGGVTLALASLVLHVDDTAELRALICAKFAKGLDAAMKVVRAIDEARAPGRAGTKGSA